VSIHVALNHVTHYRYDRLVNLSPQVGAPASSTALPHTHTLLFAPGAPADHFINWQQDPQANYLAPTGLSDETRELKIEVDVVAEMSVLNPFDFFLAPYPKAFLSNTIPTSGANWCLPGQISGHTPDCELSGGSIPGARTHHRLHRRTQPTRCGGHSVFDPA